MEVRILGPVDVNGNRREMKLTVDRITWVRVRSNPTILVSAAEFRSLALHWDFPLNAEDADLADAEATG